MLAVKAVWLTAALNSSILKTIFLAESLSAIGSSGKSSVATPLILDL